MRSIDTAPFDLAYCDKRKKWIAIPLLYIPGEAVCQNKDDVIDFGPCNPIELKNWKINVEGPINPLTWPREDLERLCQDNDIPIGWVTGQFPKPKKMEKQNSEGVHRRSSDIRKVPFLNAKERQVVLKELKKVHKQSELAIQIYLFLNRNFQEGGPVISFEEILKVEAANVSQDPRTGIVMIDLYADKPRGRRWVAHYVKDTLGYRLLKHARTQLKFLFSKNDQGFLTSAQIDFYLRKAAAKANVQKRVSSLSFRPDPTKEQLRIIKKKAEKQAQEATKLKDCDLQDVSIEEFRWLKGKVLALGEGRGRKGKADKREALNAMLFYLRTPEAKRKWPSDALYSQYKRWGKGSLEEIFRLRAEYKASQ